MTKIGNDEALSGPDQSRLKLESFLPSKKEHSSYSRTPINLNVIKNEHVLCQSWNTK